MSKEPGSSVKKVQQTLKSLGFSDEIVVFPDSTRTAIEAAQAVGCSVGQIVKSLVFKGARSHKPVLALVSGANRVNEKRLGSLVGEEIEKADADFVRQHTGFAVGGVPPVGHVERLATFIDRDLMQYDDIWAAAVSPHTGFRLTPGDLQRMAGGEVVPLQ